MKKMFSIPVFQSSNYKSQPHIEPSVITWTLFLLDFPWIFPLPFLCLTKRKNCENPWFNKWHLQTRRSWDALPGCKLRNNWLHGCMNLCVSNTVGIAGIQKVGLFEPNANSMSCFVLHRFLLKHTNPNLWRNFIAASLKNLVGMQNSTAPIEEPDEKKTQLVDRVNLHFNQHKNSL